MSREPKKKPGDMERARTKHLRRQEIQDALAAVSRGDLEVYLGLHHIDGVLCKWELCPIDIAAHHFEWRDRFLVNLGGNRLEVCELVDKDGLKAITRHKPGTFYLRDEQVLALAKPVNVAAHQWCDGVANLRRTREHRRFATTLRGGSGCPPRPTRGVLQTYYGL